MKIKAETFRVRENQKVKLKDWPTAVEQFYESKEDYKNLLEEHISALKKLQNLLFANGRYALLLIFQAMDAGGKDGAISHVMSGINPQGCEVFSFKQPSRKELAHDFLWRASICLPERGHIGIFNRSYYEETLIVRVHPELLEAEGLPEELLDAGKLWKHRFQSILNLEKHLYRNGTRVVKFFLHLSKEEQRKRFLARIEDPHKNWKLSQDDIRERDLWKDYMGAYQECLSATSTEYAPWYVVPADDKENARLIISHIVLESLKRLKLIFPESSKERQKELQTIRKMLEA
ncbi:MAG TPA: ADP-polyphosphate phosphotransferase [Verrucomicrobiae bacterium]|nr:ADP-polyphosphate phosphotransferase [Verrucomicrobiae bacterium]